MKIICFFFLSIVASPLSGQQKLTTFILLRHAEKASDGTKNPPLTEAGQQRAERLIGLLKNTTLSAIYATSYVRTHDTVFPLAKARAMEVSIYEPLKTEPIDKMLKEHEGKTILICGHSNNIPSIANYLTGAERYKDFADGDYDNILIVTVAERGKVTSAVWMNY